MLNENQPSVLKRMNTQRLNIKLSVKNEKRSKEADKTASFCLTLTLCHSVDYNYQGRNNQ